MRTMAFSATVGHHGLPAAVGLLHLGLFGRQRQQALDGVARAVHGARLDQLGNGIQRHHHRGLGPLADDEGAGDGHRHQRVDVQAPAHQRGEALLVGVEAGQPMAASASPISAAMKPTPSSARNENRLGRNGQHQRGHQARKADAHARDLRGRGQRAAYRMRGRPRRSAARA
jgi:hypothetical protein